MAPKKPCQGSPRCPNFALPGKARCSEHQREEWRLQNASRPKWVRQFYDDPRWRALRAAHLELHPQCEDCLAAGRSEAATQVDHILPMRSRPDLALESSNLRSLCMSHHSSKTLLDRRRGVGR